MPKLFVLLTFAVLWALIHMDPLKLVMHGNELTAYEFPSNLQPWVIKGFLNGTNVTNEFPSDLKPSIRFEFKNASDPWIPQNITVKPALSVDDFACMVNVTSAKPVGLNLCEFRDSKGFEAGSISREVEWSLMFCQQLNEKLVGQPIKTRPTSIKPALKNDSAPALGADWGTWANWDYTLTFVMHGTDCVGYPSGNNTNPVARLALKNPAFPWCLPNATAAAALSAGVRARLPYVLAVQFDQGAPTGGCSLYGNKDALAGFLSAVHGSDFGVCKELDKKLVGQPGFPNWD
ncbi:hypothetical protein RI367_003824 [Sorochytrium milnesiophthora]